MSNWCCEIPEEEVKMAVDQMGADKAPGPDRWVFYGQLAGIQFNLM